MKRLVFSLSLALGWIVQTNSVIASHSWLSSCRRDRWSLRVTKRKDKGLETSYSCWVDGNFAGRRNNNLKRVVPRLRAAKGGQYQ
jgi:hypothetical protein